VYRLVREVMASAIRAYLTKEMIKVTIVMAWSWKNVSWAIIGEAASCSPSCLQFAILSELCIARA
jgi:hypothetical protein